MTDHAEIERMARNITQHFEQVIAPTVACRESTYLAQGYLELSQQNQQLAKKLEVAVKFLHAVADKESQYAFDDFALGNGAKGAERVLKEIEDLGNEWKVEGKTIFCDIEKP